jgi:hypothetical protein
MREYRGRSANPTYALMNRSGNMPKSSEPYPNPRIELRLPILSRYQIADAAFDVAKLFKNHRKNVEHSSSHF